MYKTKRRTKKIKGVSVETWNRNIVDANLLSVEAGTNGYQGGDTGHGSRTYLKIMNEGGTDINARVITDRFGYTEGIEIVLGGDSELSTFIEALKFATKVQEASL